MIIGNRDRRQWRIHGTITPGFRYRHDPIIGRWVCPRQTADIARPICPRRGRIANGHVSAPARLMATCQLGDRALKKALPHPLRIPLKLLCCSDLTTA